MAKGYNKSKAASSEPKRSAYDLVTERIIEKLAEGVAPWRKQWKAGTSPQNAVSGKAYRGGNFFALALMPYEDHRWLTFKQAIDLGGNVKKGEKSAKIIFWKFDREDKEEGKERRAPFCISSSVFNVEQCEGLKIKPLSELHPQGEGMAPIEAAQIIADGMPNAPTLSHGSDQACYSPMSDAVRMPSMTQFADAESYYATLFHEFTHSTGAEKRLNRPGITNFDRFGSEKYALEELVAELGAAFLCAQCGLDSTLDQSAAYISGWSSRLSTDPRFFVTAAAQAQKAADYILGIKFGEVKEEADDSD